MSEFDPPILAPNITMRPNLATIITISQMMMIIASSHSTGSSATATVIASLLYFLFPHVYYWGGKLEREETAPLIKQVLFWAMHIHLLVLWVRAITTQGFLLVVLIPISLFVADFLAGMVHFLGDHTEQEQFINHHKEPTYMCGKSYLHHTFRSYVLALLVLLPTVWLPSPLAHLSVMTAFFTVQANEHHVWLHCSPSKVPYLVTVLQGLGLLITAQTHRQHHYADHDAFYCTLNGWANHAVNHTSRAIRHVWRVAPKIETRIPKWVD